MGMTDSQFKGFIRFVLNDLVEIQGGDDPEKQAEKLKKVIENLQKVLED